MIKVCSLDFINKKTFGTDILTADGRLLVRADDKVSSDMVLRLYFKDIYVDKPNVESSIIITHQLEESVVNDMEEAIASDATAGKFAASVVQSGPRSIDSSFVDTTELSSGPRFVETDELGEDVASSSGPRMDYGFDDDSGSNIAGDDKNRCSDSQEAEVKPEPKPEDELLQFNEEQAQRMVKSSVAIGKLLNFSAGELKELEHAAYYCNIGISKFKKSDLAKKNFRKSKAQASYELIYGSEKVSDKVAESIKFSANSYESESFPLNSKIPYSQIISITSYYEDMLLSGSSKTEVLLKMLQVGGNEFNIFVLHKFIKMMRDANE